MNAEEPIQRGRGRPKSHGHRQGVHLMRAAVVVEAYHAIRTQGAKHDVAVKAALVEVRHVFPQMHCSISLIKQILAEFMSSKPDRLSLKVTVVHRTPQERQINPNAPALPAVSYGIGLDKRPAYPRANAAVKKAKTQTARPKLGTKSEPQSRKQLFSAPCCWWHTSG